MACENSSFIGPALPKKMCLQIPTSCETSIKKNESNCSEDIGTAINLIGPLLPPHLVSKQESLNDSSLQNSFDTDTSELEGSSQDVSDTYGPVLPPHLKKPLVTPHCDDNSSESDCDAIGPVPEGSVQEMSLNQQKLEIRAKYLKKKMAEENASGKEKPSRESWMLELPPGKAKNLGLGPRTFRMKEGPDMTDRSDWTDTPADRARKQLLGEVDCRKNFKEEMDMVVVNERNKVMDQMVDKCKGEKKQLSLLEMHREKLLKKKKEKEKGNEKPERRPFDRNIDLQANRFDEAQKKSIFKKAKLLDTRFSAGESKYL